jgi:hypothetical protein
MDKKNVFKAILKDLKERKTSGISLNFSCYSEGMLSYTCNIKGLEALIEINIICDDVLFDSHTPEELLKRKRITYLGYSVYEGYSDEKQRILNLHYRPFSGIEYN